MPAPPRDVLEAFAASGVEPTLMFGGQGSIWRVGDVVLKPVGNPAEHAWVCDVFDGWSHHDAVRVPQPLCAKDGSWVHAGWAAHAFVAGRDALIPEELDAVRAASDTFHARVRGLARPDFLDQRCDPWAFGDRVAWEGAAPEGHEPTRELIAEGLAALEPVHTPFQVIHGDIAGNILVAEGLPPAVIDWPPYFRPAGFALAVAAGDAIAWQGAPVTLLEAWADIPEWDQLLLRAVIYRVATRGRSEVLCTARSSGEQYVEERRPLEAVLERLANR